MNNLSYRKTTSRYDVWKEIGAFNILKEAGKIGG